MKTTPTAPRTEEEITPSAPVPARTERRVNTTQPQPQPGSGPEDLSEPEPLLPHERDESVDMTHGKPDVQMEQAYRDVKRGLLDTDRGPPADKAYQKQK
ncbi:hypothetical protein ASE39_06200 [Acidovorax sp. Root267]|uniref:hypothetical protein n=1 Tax=Acidovorax sp. Root267 TaxID=1736505 RepID=UPI00070F0A4F|nr:hypothetical protein [Acidovorax sp. Root267]KRD21983.1 hypothetical protein ASE39_06200 [Acidovorax sp. Root267]